MDSANRAAALPVGAASAMRIEGSCCANTASSRATEYVLPVPGPPTMSDKRFPSTTSAACRCRLSSPRSTAGRRASSVATAWVSNATGTSTARARIERATAHSSNQ